MEPSVALAIQLLDGFPLRTGGSVPMSVTQAKFEQKGERFVTKQTDNKKKKKKLKKVEDEMLDWGGRDDSKLMIPAIVILNNMFTPAEMRADLNLKDELEADIREGFGGKQIGAVMDDGSINHSSIRDMESEDASLDTLLSLKAMRGLKCNVWCIGNVSVAAVLPSVLPSKYLIHRVK